MLAALVALSCALPASAGAAGITFVAPPGARAYPDQSLGPAGYTEAPVAFRTADTRPTIGIQADGGTQLQCHFDNVFVTQSCGGPAPGCAAICGSFQPSAPLGPDSDQFSRSHFLAVDLVDADGNSVASVWVNLDVDTTPSVIQVDTAGGTLTNQADTAPLRPAFSYRVTDSNSVGTNVDTVACAWGPAAASPAFGSCAGRPGSGVFAPGRLAARHRLYRLQVRGTDDFGRSTTASGFYDPVPCALSIRRPTRIASLLSSGIPTRLSCDTIRHVSVAVYAFMVNGDRSATPRGAVSDNPILGRYGVSSASGTFTASKRLRLSGAARAALRGAHSLGLVLAAGDPDKIVAGIADDSLSYQVLTLRR
ncbi:MAG: hypothetical protein ACXVRM_05120 [Solirubrobacteraceae bacterium]